MTTLPARWRSGRGRARSIRWTASPSMIASRRCWGDRDGLSARLSRHPHQRLAEILALQHAEEGGGRVLQPVDDVLAVFKAAAAHPFARLAQEVALPGGEIRND